MICIKLVPDFPMRFFVCSYALTMIDNYFDIQYDYQSPFSVFVCAYIQMGLCVCACCASSHSLKESYRHVRNTQESKTIQQMKQKNAQKISREKHLGESKLNCLLLCRGEHGMSANCSLHLYLCTSNLTMLSHHCFFF